MFNMPTAAKIDGLITAGDVEGIKRLHIAAKTEVNVLKAVMSSLTEAQHDLERKMIDIKDGKNRQAVMIREHQLAVDTLNSAMFEAIDRRKEMNHLAG
ncbi:MAG: hypothetical protein WC886_07910, partial [Saccharofermentanaceae bacterium]